MNPKLFSFLLFATFCVSFVRCSPVEAKNETIKIVPTEIPSALTTVIPSTKDLKPENKTSDAKNETIISNKTAESPHGIEPLPVHIETNITTINTTSTNTTNNNTTMPTTIPNNRTESSTTTPTPTPAVTPTKTAAPTEVTTAKIPTTVTTSTTVHPVTILPTSKVEEKEKDRGFDGPSFIGGIVLAIGLTGIGFVAYKFCKARNDRNYRNF